MRRMMACVTLVGAAALVAGMALAGTDAGTGAGTGGGQSGRGQGMRGFGGGGIVDRIVNELGLTTEQTDKINALRPQLQQKIQDAARDQTKRQEAMDWYQGEVRNLLTDEQKTKFDALVKGVRARLEEAGRLLAATRVDSAINGLKLDDATKAKLDQLKKERDQRIEAAANAYKDALMPLLTPEQQETLKKALAPQAPAAGASGDAPGNTRGNTRNRGGNGGTGGRGTRNRGNGGGGSGTPGGTTPAGGSGPQA